MRSQSEYLQHAEDISEAANGCGLQQFVVAIDHNVYEIIERLTTSECRGISAVVINHLILLCVALVFIK